MNQCEKERWENVTELSAEGYEVGWEYLGHPTGNLERDALEEMLTRYGRHADIWLMPPEVVVRHSEVEADPLILGQLSVTAGCRWFVYGILAEEPSVGAIPAGGRLPRYGEREFDVRQEPA